MSIAIVMAGFRGRGALVGSDRRWCDPVPGGGYTPSSEEATKNVLLSPTLCIAFVGASWAMREVLVRLFRDRSLLSIPAQDVGSALEGRYAPPDMNMDKVSTMLDMLVPSVVQAMQETDAEDDLGVLLASVVPDADGNWAPLARYWSSETGWKRHDHNLLDRPLRALPGDCTLQEELRKGVDVILDDVVLHPRERIERSIAWLAGQRGVVTVNRHCLIRRLPASHRERQRARQTRGA